VYIRDLLNQRSFRQCVGKLLFDNIASRTRRKYVDVYIHSAMRRHGVVLN
jgi:hypothetical protein